MERNWAGFLHPGEMGSALAGVVRRNGFHTCWTGHGRSSSTRARAARAGLKDVSSLAELCERSALVVSICPPHAARDVAQEVASLGYDGLYVDANAISPGHAADIAALVGAGGATFVDAAIIGPPPVGGTNTRLYLCGPAAEQAARYFAGGAIGIDLLGPEIGRASALKICHSSMHKGMLALLFSALATAERLGVRAELERSWASGASTSSYVSSMDDNLRRAGKAWRFAGEMDEAAHALEAAGLPVGFHRAASEIFQRLAAVRDRGPDITLQELLSTLLVETGVQSER